MQTTEIEQEQEWLVERLRKAYDDVVRENKILTEEIRSLRQLLEDKDRK